jgi:4a-hydroxytetrahydrobiopterin dehydratase
MPELIRKRCRTCEADVPPLGAAELAVLVPQVPGWQVLEGDRKLSRRFLFRDFTAAMAFVNAMAELAEEEGHHPDFNVHYSTVDVTLWTHAIGGLSENDFILAAKIGELKAAG